MTEAWLSDGWWAAAAAEMAGVTGPPTLSGTVDVEVTGGPDGDVAGHVVFAGGRLVASGPGAATGADATLTLTDVDARAVATGDLELSVAFMQGRMKVAGAMAPVLDLLVLAGTDDVRIRRARVAEQTDL